MILQVLFPEPVGEGGGGTTARVALLSGVTPAAVLPMAADEIGGVARDGAKASVAGSVGAALGVGALIRPFDARLLLALFSV